MRKYKTTYLTQTIKEVKIETKIICNSCGKEVDLEKQALEVWQAECFNKFQISFGYGSKEDGNTWFFDLCDDCVIKLCENFVIKPEVASYL